MGRDVRQTELWQIASYGKRNVVRLRTYEDLDRVIDKAVNTYVSKLCWLLKILILLIYTSMLRIVKAPLI